MPSYHDHNWGNVSPGELLDTWWWGRGDAGENTFVTYVIRGNKNVGASEIVLYYVASASGVKLNAVGKGVRAVEGAERVHRDPKHVRSIPSGITVAANGYRTEFGGETAPILSLDLLKDQPYWKRTLARTMGMKPWYTRFDSPITLETPHQKATQGDGILEYYELH